MVNALLHVWYEAFETAGGPEAWKREEREPIVTSLKRLAELAGKDACFKLLDHVASGCATADPSTFFYAVRATIKAAGFRRKDDEE